MLQKNDLLLKEDITNQLIYRIVCEGMLGKTTNIFEDTWCLYTILSSNNVDFNIHEDNQNQGAWASEERIHFKSEQGVPECLKRNMTAGKAGIYGRINCKEFCDMVRAEARRKL